MPGLFDEFDPAVAAPAGGAFDEFDPAQARAPRSDQPFNPAEFPETSQPYTPGFLENRQQDIKNFAGGFTQGGRQTAEGLSHAIALPFGGYDTSQDTAQFNAAHDIAGPQGKAGKVGQFAGAALPFFAGAGPVGAVSRTAAAAGTAIGLGTAGTSVLGNVTQENLDEGVHPVVAALRGLGSAGLTILAPAAAGKVAGGLVGKLSGGVADTLAPHLGATIAEAFGGTAEAAGLGGATGVVQQAGEAGVSLATGDTDKAIQQAGQIPEAGLGMALMGGAMHAAGEPARMADERAAIDQASSQQALQSMAPERAQEQIPYAQAPTETLPTIAPEAGPGPKRVTAEDIAALRAAPAQAAEAEQAAAATPPPAELAANEAALQATMQKQMAAEQEAQLKNAVAGEETAKAAAAIEAQQAAAEPVRAATASGAGLENHVPVPPSEAETATAMYEASKAIQDEHQATLEALRAAREKGEIGKPQRSAMEDRLDEITHARHEEAIKALQEGKPVPIHRPMAEEINLTPKTPEIVQPEKASIPAPKTAGTAPAQDQGIPHDRKTGQALPREGQGRQNDAGSTPNAREGVGAAPSNRNLKARGGEGRNAAPREVAEPLALQAQRKKVGRLQDRLQRAKMTPAEQTAATQEFARENAKLSAMEPAPAPNKPAVKAAAPEAPLGEATARRQLTAALTGTRVKETQRQAVVDTAMAHLREIGKVQGKTLDEMLAKHLHRIQRSDLPKGKTGGVEFLEDGKAIIHIAETADETTVGHELLHIFRRYLPDADLGVLENRYGINRGEWATTKGRKAEEQFVADAEREQQTGTAPTEGMGPIFAKFKEWATSVGRAVMGNPKVKTTPDFKAVLDRMYTEGLGEKYQKTGTETPVEAVKPAEAPVETVAAEKPIAAEMSGIKNEVSAADRERLGLPQRDTPEGRSFDEMYDAGKAKAEKDPFAINSLINELKTNPERIVSSVEEAGLLLKHKIDLENGLHALVDKVDAARAEGDANGELIARVQLEGHRTAVKEFTELTERAGTAVGRALVSRKMMSDMDYSLSHMETEAEAAKGSKLTEPELKKVRILYQTIANKTAAKGLLGKTQLKTAQRLWQEEVRSLESAKRTVGQKIAEAVKAAPGFTKSLMASMDDSAVFRQGWRAAFTHPDIWSKNALRTFEDMWHTFGGKEVLDAVRAEIESDPYYEQMRIAKLAIHAPEEQHPSSILEKIPVAGKAYKAAETAFTAFQYRNRAQIFSRLLQVAEKSGVDITNRTQLRDIGTLVNSLTSRGSLGPAEPIGSIINNVFFSARKLRSDLDFFTAHGGGAGLKTPFARKQAAINLAKVMAGTAMILMIAKAANPASVELDPRSADFGKIKAGNTRFEVMGGASPLFSLVARLIIGSTKNSTTGDVHALNEMNAKGALKFGSQTKAGVISDFAAKKLSPMAGVLLSYFRGQRANRQPFTLLGAAEDLLVPMVVSNFIELQNDTQATPELTAAGIAADFFGIGVHTYDNAKK